MGVVGAPINKSCRSNRVGEILLRHGQIEERPWVVYGVGSESIGGGNLVSAWIDKGYCVCNGVCRVIGLALGLLVRPWVIMAMVGIILVSYMPTTGPSGRDLVKLPDAIAGDPTLRPTTRVRVATRTK